MGKDLNLPKASELGKAGELCLGTVKAKAYANISPLPNASHFSTCSPAPLSPAQLMAVALTSICLSAQALAYPEGGATSVA